MGRELDKQEAVLYGKFVNAAYKMFEDNPGNTCPEPEEIPEP